MLYVEVGWPREMRSVVAIRAETLAITKASKFSLFEDKRAQAEQVCRKRDLDRRIRLSAVYIDKSGLPAFRPAAGLFGDRGTLGSVAFTALRR